MSFFVNASDMALKMAEYLCEKNGINMSENDKNHFKNTYGKVLSKMDDDFCQSLGIKKLHKDHA